MLHMLLSYGYKYIVQARNLLTGQSEQYVFTCKTDKTLGQFLFEEILYFWGGLKEIIIDNSSAFMTALDWIAIRYYICYIRISAYNLQANGVIETMLKGVQKGIAYWDKQNNDMPAPNCMLKVRGEIIKDEDL